MLVPTSTPPRVLPEAGQSGLTEAFRAWQARPVRRATPALYWGLVALAVLLVGGVVALGAYLVLGLAAPGASPAPAEKLAIPFADRDEVWRGLRAWPVQQDGRVKPFATFSAEAVRTITGTERFEGNDPVAVVASWLLTPDEDLWEKHPFLLCHDHELRALLYREYRGAEEPSDQDLHGKYVAPAVLRESRAFQELLRSGAARTLADAKARLTTAEKKARELQKRLAMYDRIRRGGPGPVVQVAAPGDFGLAALDDQGGAWFSPRAVLDLAEEPKGWDAVLDHRRLRDVDRPDKKQPFPRERVDRVVKAWAALRDGYRSGEEATFGNALSGFLVTVGEAGEPQPGVVDEALLTRELWFNRVLPFRKAWVASLAACVLLLGSVLVGEWGRWPGRILYALGLFAGVGCLGWAAVGFWCRVTLSGRPPVSNMYESVIWVAFMTAGFGLMLEGFYRRRVIALAACGVATLGFVLADQLPLTFSPSIQPLQAVLRSNYWLVVHVLTIVSSYAAFALAWGLGNLTLALIVWAPGRADLVGTLSRFCYRAIQIGVVLLAAGTLLGGFWAAESWGRFWGWDPKEVWALVALLCYLIPLHARHVGWVRDFGLALSAVVCFSSVVMAWYGVNFILGAGLHSYGFGGGNDLWVYWAGLFNLTLAVLATLRHVGRRPALGV